MAIEVSMLRAAFEMYTKPLERICRPHALSAALFTLQWLFLGKWRQK